MKQVNRILWIAAWAVLLGACNSGREVPTGNLLVMSEPEGAVVEVNGEAIGTTPLNEHVEAGNLLISVRRPGYETERLSLHLGAGAREVREVSLRPMRGLVVIDSNPSGAGVSIGNQFRGETPVTLHNLRFGEYRARLTMSGYEDQEVEFELEERVPRRINVDMVSTSGRLVVHSEPSGARVYVDGREQGETPLSLDRVEQGERDIAVQLEGYETFRRNVLISPDDTSRVDARLRQQPGALRVVTRPGGARIYLDEEYQGDSPLEMEDLSPGTYVVRAELRGHADESRNVRLERGEARTEEIRLERDSGTLEIVTRPANVRVIVNGEYMGTTRPREGGTDEVSEPLQVEMLSRGAHTLQLVREGYQFESKRFRIHMDEVTALDETLRRIFIPNTLLRTGVRPEDAVIGRLVRQHANGDVEMEIREGIYRTYSADDIHSIEPLREEHIEEFDVEMP